MEHSDFQLQIFSELANEDTNIVISAVAGSGKTTTLVDCLHFVPKNKDVIFLAFNNAIVDELKKRIGNQPNISITTSHSFGWRNMLRHFSGKIEMKPAKSMAKIAKVIKKNKVPKQKQAYYFYNLSKVVDIARLSLVDTPEKLDELCDRHDLPMSEEELNYAIDILDLMKRDNSCFDFADMLNFPAVNDIRLTKYDYIFVDEAQDLSPAQQAIIKKIRNRGGRMIAVGDPRQAIYGFVGADVESFNNLKTMFPNTVELPLSVNYRCGKRIVSLAKKINPEILPFEENSEGIVRNGFIEEIKLGDWVLCRNTKPLILMNLYLLSKGVKSYVRGKDIGLSLINFISKTKATSIKSMFKILEANLAKERGRLRRVGVHNTDNSTKIINFLERVEILEVLSENIDSTFLLKKKINKIFDDKIKGICLSTIHKSKGLENNRIFILCPELMPSQYATQEWQQLQEKNLEYVCITRAKKELVFITDFAEKIKKQRDERKSKNII